MGTASVTHQIVIKIATPAVSQATLLSPSGDSVKKKLNSINKPAKSPYKDILFFANNIYLQKKFTLSNPRTSKFLYFF